MMGEERTVVFGGPRCAARSVDVRRADDLDRQGAQRFEVGIDDRRPRADEGITKSGPGGFGVVAQSVHAAGRRPEGHSTPANAEQFRMYSNAYRLSRQAMAPE